VLDPAGEPDGSADMGGQLVREDALHGGHLLRIRLEVRAGGAPAVPPHFAAAGGLVGPCDGGRSGGF
jgi:hypothetical protein